MEILPGQETRIYGEMVEDYEKGEILTLAEVSTYVFVNFLPEMFPLYRTTVV